MMYQKQQGKSGSSKQTIHSRNKLPKEEKIQRGMSLQPTRPSTYDHAAWTEYWLAQGKSWRTEPEIDQARQKELERCRSLEVDITKGIYPFKGIKLERADVEWLVATLESEHEDMDRKDTTERVGLDLRGTDLRKANLRHLPLNYLNGGLTLDEWLEATEEQRSMARIQLEGADLWEAQLDKAKLCEAQLRGANLKETQLRGANLRYADLEGANLVRAHLEGANLYHANLEGANLYRTHLEGANLIGTQLKRTKLRRALLEEADLSYAKLESTDLSFAKLKTVYLTGIILSGEQHVGPKLADVHWGETNLAVVDWSQVSSLGDEYEAGQAKTDDGEKKANDKRLSDYQIAVRANRQLAVALQAQGLNEEAARFAYQAHRLQRIVLRRQKKFGSYLFSIFLDLIAGYGYRPRRSIIAYLIIIFVFTILYLLNSHFVAPHLRWDEALVLSISSFHGRGFFSQNISLGDTYARLAAAEAIIGLIIEISFIATFTQRFFGK